MRADAPIVGSEAQQGRSPGGSGPTAEPSGGWQFVD